jgi:hypothetical protein
MRTRCTLVSLCAGLALGVALPAFAADTAAPATTPLKHLGVATCATSVCHGKIAPQTGRDVQLNEYRIWLQQDRHSQAYRALDKPLARSMAAKLGIPNASAAKVCLDCHADNVPAAARGPSFQLVDGIQCEACHGGAERWIETHSQQNATHPANLARGMYPTDQPGARAQLCLSCHLGTAGKYVTHAMIGAGHPRLRFELDTFSENQPKHFTVDADYIERKGKVDEANLWLAGQIGAARDYLTLLQSPLYARPGLFPELAFYDCFGCHHSIDKLRWSADRAGPGIGPGTLRLQKQHALTVQAAAEAIGDAAAATALGQQVTALTRAGQTDAAAMRADANRLSAQLQSVEAWTRRAFSRADLTAIRRTLLKYAADDRASDFLAAEQVELGVESLSYALGDHDRHTVDIDALYNAVKTNATFDPTQFAAVARTVSGHF